MQNLPVQKKVVGVPATKFIGGVRLTTTHEGEMEEDPVVEEINSVCSGWTLSPSCYRFRVDSRLLERSSSRSSRPRAKDAIDFLSGVKSADALLEIQRQKICMSVDVVIALRIR